jgi:two-component system NtrC family sensor kinase
MMSIKAADNSAVPRLEPGFFERLFAGAGLPICLCDLRGEVIACNQLGEGVLGANPASSNLRDLLPESARARWHESFKAIRRSAESIEFRMSSAGIDGEMKDYATWLTPIFDQAGKLEAVAVWFHEITSRMQVRRTLRQRERLTTLGTLSGSVAHHYNNLLCCIATSLEYAMNMNTMTAMRRALRRAISATGRANELTQQLLAFAQGDYRAADMADVTETVLRYCDDNEQRLHERGVRLVLDRQPTPVVAVPRDQLLIVLNNLTNNAAEAMPEGGDLTVSLRPRGKDHLSITVSDTGSGVKPEHLEHLFEPFFTTKGELGDGPTHQAGMGLAVAHGFVSEMHGTITVTNLPERGLRFEITLPVPPAHATR